MAAATMRNDVDTSMMALVPVTGSSKMYKVLPWTGPKSSSRLFIYKDEDEHVTPGTELRRTEQGFEVVHNLPLRSIANVNDLAQRRIHLESAEFKWFQEMKCAKKPIASGDGKPWVVVIMGTPGAGKSSLMQSDQQKAFTEAIGVQVPFSNLVFKQLDDIVGHAARPDLQALWAACRTIEDPHERFRAYWAGKQAIFTRYAVDKPAKTDQHPNPQSYEFNVSARMVELLSEPASQYNIAMETTGLSPALVKFGLTAPHYKNYNKLVVLVDIDNVEKAKTITHSRLIQEMNTETMYGGEQFGDYLDVICDRARATFKTCQDMGDAKNQELDAARSDEGRWYFHTVKQTFDVNPTHHQRIDAFYHGRNSDKQQALNLTDCSSSPELYDCAVPIDVAADAMPCFCAARTGARRVSVASVATPFCTNAHISVSERDEERPTGAAPFMTCFWL